MSWSLGRGLLLVCAGAFALGALFVVADDAEATHFWSGSLSWETVGDPTQSGAVPDPDAAMKVTGYLGFDTKAFYANCAAAQPGMVLNGPGSLTVNGVPVGTWALLLEYVDPNPSGSGTGGHCRFAGKIIDPATLDGVIVSTLDKQPGDEMLIQWTLTCCREDHDHVNNPDKNVYLQTRMTKGDPNRSPVIDFPHLTRITNHGAAAYGNHHCPAKALCKFWVEAKDPDNDTMSWRLATSTEAVGPSSFSAFVHPPNFAVDTLTGLVTWDTAATNAKQGKIYSTQIIVEDGMTGVPVDFMVEVGPGCENGFPGVVDPDTGELICEPPEEPPIDPEPCQEDPDAEGCQSIPPQPPQGKPYQHAYWPQPLLPILVDPTVSDSAGAASAPLDGSLSSVSRIDSDGDTIIDADDLCPGSPTPLNGDMDGDGRGDGCDDDDDGDGILDDLDACPLDPEVTCGVDAQGKDVSDGAEGSRGFFSGSDAPAKEDARVSVQDGASAASGKASFALLGVLAAALVLLLVATRRRS